MSIYRCALEMTSTAGIWANIWHINHVTGEADAIAIAFHNYVASAYANCLVSQVTLSNMVVTELVNHEQYTEAIGVAGTTTAEMCPPQAAAVISWRTTKAGRAFRGRTYVPGLSEGAQHDGRLESAYKNLLNTLAAAIHSGWPQSFSGSHVVYHRGSNTYDLITGWLLRDIVYTQRRRTLGVGV